jgi:hypothetical protein
VPEILLSGVNKNASPISCIEAGYLPQFSKVKIYISSNAKKNLLKLSDINQYYPISVDSTLKTFSCHNDIGQNIEFAEKFQIYCRSFQPADETDKEIFLNQELNKKEFEQAKLARTISRRLGHEPDSGMLKIMRAGAINNLPIAYKDVINAKSIFGPDIASIKGKTTNKDTHNIPQPERVSKHLQKIQDLIIDIMYVNNEPFLVSVSRPLDLIIVDHLPSYDANETKSKITIQTSLFSILGKYHAEGFHVKNIICDAEAALIAMEEKVNAYGSKLSYSLSSSHSTSIIDRKIRFIKDRARSTLHSLSFPLPTIFLKWLIYFVVSHQPITSW